MNSDDTKQPPRDMWEEARQSRAKRAAEEAYYDDLGPAGLVDKLMEVCEINHEHDNDEIRASLRRQALLLDKSFTTVLHQSGFGRRADLSLEPYKVALNTQKLCRQTYDTLKSEKQTIERKKDD